MKRPKFLLYALGEIILIVVGILLALFINNKNIDRQYKTQIDTNILRAYEELGDNLNQSRNTISQLRTKDSVINLVMIDSLIEKDYYNNLNIPFLSIQNVQQPFEDKAIQNLAQINISGNQYKEKMLTDLKELNSLMQDVERQNDLIANFITESSIPLLAGKIKSFGDLTYKRVVKKDAVDFFLNAEEYKSNVSQYAIYAIRNQLESNRMFYNKGLAVYHSLSESYELVNKQVLNYSEDKISNYTGKFIREDYPDTLEVAFARDSFFVGRGERINTYLVPLNEDQYFLDGAGQERYFVSFEEDEKSRIKMRFDLFSDRLIFKKVE